MTKGLFHVLLTSTNIERTIKFYSDSFDNAKVSYPFEIDGHKLHMVSLGNGLELEVWESDVPVGPEKDARWGHIAIECDDLQGQFNRMVAAGASVMKPITWDIVLNGEPKTYCAGAFVRGPNDEVIELCYSEKKWPWRD